MRDTEKCSRGVRIKGSFEEKKGIHKGNHSNSLLGSVRLRFSLFYAEGAKHSVLSESFKYTTAFKREDSKGLS